MKLPRWWPIGAMVLGMLLSIASVFLMLEAKKQEARQVEDLAGSGGAADPSRSWNLPTGTLPADDDPDDAGAAPGTPPAAQGLQQQAQQTLAMLQQMNDALTGQHDPLAQPLAKPAGGGEPEPLPFSVPQRIAYGFFVLSPAAAAAALQGANPSGRRLPKHVTRILIQNLEKPGASTSAVIRVQGRTDPGPGVGAMLAGLGLPGVLPPLFGDPVVLDAGEARERLRLLEKGLEEVGGADALGARAALWRVKVLQPELETAIGTVPPPGEPLLPHQLEVARKARYEPDAQLIRSLLSALKAAAEGGGEADPGPRVLLMVKTVA
ncbi:MAG: hypothetical protein P1V51_01695 [Deltaproteobacteria bacterium]|nr:hypothetical protein [Deltaproteobacteria bacterium]